MHWFAGVSYLAAGTVSQLNGRSPMFAFISIVLTIWLGIAAIIESRSTPPDMSLELNGWTTSLSTRTVESVRSINQLAFFATLMRFSLIFFGFLLMSWALLP